MPPRVRSTTWASRSRPPTRSGPRRPAWPGRAWTPPPRTRSRAATPCRTRCGWTARTARPGRSTPSWPTPSTPRAGCARSRSAGTPCAAGRPRSRHPAVADMTDAPLSRRMVAEATGTGMLVAVVVGSGIAAQRLYPSDPGGALLANSLATGAGLVAIILAFGAISGAHLNPTVTMAGWLSGTVPRREVAPYAAAQIGGGLVGVAVANLMFDQPAVSIATSHRATAATTFSEVVATFGLLIVITGLARARRLDAAPYAVGAYITAAYWFTSSTSFANPAVTIARALTDTFAGIAPASVPPFVAAQLAGAALAVALAAYLHARPAPTEGATMPPTPAVPTAVFLCVHNAGRSQMALGWLDHLAAGRVVGYSAGSEPADRLNPVAVAAMAEVG